MNRIISRYVKVSPWLWLVIQGETWCVLYFNKKENRLAISYKTRNWILSDVAFTYECVTWIDLELWDVFLTEHGFTDIDSWEGTTNFAPNFEIVTFKSIAWNVSISSRIDCREENGMNFETINNSKIHLRDTYYRIKLI